MFLKTLILSSFIFLWILYFLDVFMLLKVSRFLSLNTIFFGGVLCGTLFFIIFFQTTSLNIQILLKSFTKKIIVYFIFLQLIRILLLFFVKYDFLYFFPIKFLNIIIFTLIILYIWLFTSQGTYSISDDFKLNKWICILKKLFGNVYLCLSLIILFYVLIKLLVQYFSPGMGIEGDLVFYDAKLFLDGLIPYKDFITREPYLLFITSIFLYFLKDNLIIFENFYLIFSVLNIIFIYKLGSLMFTNKKLGIISALLFSFSPYLLRYPSYDFQFYNSLYLCFFTLILYFLTKSIRSLKKIDFLILGLLLGTTIWIYRGILPCVVLIPFITSFLLKQKNNFDLKKILKLNSLTFIGFNLTLLPPIIYYLSLVELRWLNLMLTLKQVLILYLAYFPIILITYFYQELVLKKKSKIIQNITLSSIIMVVGYLLFYSEAVSTDSLERISVISDYFRHIGYFLLPSLFFISNTFFEKMFPDINNKKNYKFVFNLIIFTIVLYGIDHIARGASYEISLPLIIFFCFCVGLYGLIFFKHTLKIKGLDFKMDNEIFIMSFFIVVYFLMNLLFIEWVDTYIVNYVIPSLFLTILYFKTFLNKSRLVLILAILSILLGAFSVIYYFDYNLNKASQIRKTELNQVLLYLKQNTNQNEMIFSGNPSFAFRSNHPIAMNITHPLVYITDTPFFQDYDPYNNVPSINEIIQYLKNNEIKIIIADSRTKALFISDRHQDLQEYIQKTYEIDATFGDVDVYKKTKNELSME